MKLTSLDAATPGRERPLAGPNRRQFSAMLLSALSFPFLNWPNLKVLGAQFEPPLLSIPKASYPLYEEAVSRVLPTEGFPSLISLDNSVVRLVECGVIDRGKFFDLNRRVGVHLAEFDSVLKDPSDERILLTVRNAPYYVNLLWPLGLSNYLTANRTSPLNGMSLYSFASTGGWTLGHDQNGGVYFNKFPLVSLTPSEEARVVRIAQSTYRPCCNNSTFFQDCNHGSALFGLLQLGASQGLSDDELYREALAFNAFWFPEYYLRTALLFKVVRDTEWANVDPRVVLSAEYSAAGPWRRNVATKIDAIPGLIPPAPGRGAGCGA